MRSWAGSIRWQMRARYKAGIGQVQRGTSSLRRLRRIRPANTGPGRSPALPARRLPCARHKAGGALQAESGHAIHPVLQLRYHDCLRRFRKMMEWRDPERPVQVTVRYITRRGQWFGISWKGDPARSGTIIFNIGIHLLDGLTWAIGAAPEVIRAHADPRETEPRAGSSSARSPSTGPCRPGKPTCHRAPVRARLGTSRWTETSSATSPTTPVSTASSTRRSSRAGVTGSRTRPVPSSLPSESARWPL